MTACLIQNRLYVLLTLSLLAAGCSVSSTVTKSSPDHGTSLASTLGSVQSGGPQAKPKPPDPAEEGSRLFRLAMQQLEQQHSQQALQLFEQSAKADPTQPATDNNLGILYKQTGQLDKAIDAYRQAVALQAVYPNAYYNLALAYRAKGQFKEAEEAYLKALDQNNHFADARYNLGILYELYLGEPAKALTQYQAYLQLNGPHTKDVSTWASALERLVPEPAPSVVPTPQPPAPAQPADASPQTSPVTQNNQTGPAAQSGTVTPAAPAQPSAQSAPPQGGSAP
jgi:Tfp pilus assembly protein PilF